MPLRATRPADLASRFGRNRFWPATRNVVALALALAFATLLAAAGTVQAAVARPEAARTLRYAARFDAAALDLGQAFERHELHAGTLARTWERGAAELPYQTLTFLVARGSRLVGLRAQAAGEPLVVNGITLAPAAPMADENGNAIQAPLPRPADTLSDAVAASSELYPAAFAEPAGTGMLHGYQLLSVRVYPVHYDAAHARVLIHSRIDLELDLAPGGAEPVARERFSGALEASARATLKTLVANPEALESYDRRIGILVEQPGGFRPTDAPSLEGSDVDYIIITTDALAARWQVLADWKTRRGVPAVVRTVEWIQANYRHGSDLQETIRIFIKDAYAKWAVQYVLLGGDTDLLPARYGYSGFVSDDDQHVPTDLYFGCLDGNWNKDGDALWGEGALSAVAPVDSTDLYPEVHVGRLPTSTVATVDAMVAKVMAYENPTQTAYQNKVLLLGEVLFPIDWDPSQTATQDGADLCESVATELAGCSSVMKLYQNTVDFPAATLLTRQKAIDEMNSGYGFVNHVGHGYRYNMSVGDASLQNSHATALTNTDKTFLLFMLNCTATAFDFPCLAEAFLGSPGGAVAALGASRTAFPLTVQPYNTNFFDAVFQQSKVHVAEAWDQSRLAQTPNALLDNADHYTHFMYACLADPEMVLHTCMLGTTAATFPSTINPGLVNITVNVTVNGVARAGALVCLQKGTEEYRFGTTNGAGAVTLPFRAESAGLVQVTVSGQNMRTLLGNITVLTGGLSYVRAQSVTIDDTPTAPSNGNSDGTLDAGETLELSMTFQNSGSAAANGVTGILRVPSPYVTVPDSTYNLANMAAGATATSTNQVRFLVTSNAPDGTVLPLTFLSTKAPTTYTDIVNRVVHAPVLRHVLLKVDDTPAGGNGDGVIQAGETFDLLATFKNYGSGAADGLGATLTSVDPDVTIFNAAVSVGRANPLAEVSGATRFRLRESLLAENALTLTLTDNYGRALVVPITLRGPATPALPVLDVTTGSNVILVSCTPNVDADLAGYHVYRATNAAGPWTRVTADRTQRVAYFRDTGLLPNTRYYYAMTAVDASGNESARSAAANASTNPAQVLGWPIAMLAPTSCPVVVGDITGDGNKEIIAGNEHLYAWTSAGVELRDDDNNPQTWGVFANEIKTITGAIALGDVDRTRPGFEVCVGAWDDSNKVFVVRGDGSFAPGWPQNPDPSSAQKGNWAGIASIDVDGDGRPEIFSPAKNGSVYAWHWNGTPLGGSAAFKTGLGIYARTPLSFANFDGDPYSEIVYGAPNGVLNVWNADGSVVAPFPKTLGSECLSGTAIGDVNKDGVLDIVMITEGGAIHVINSKTGLELPGWPKSHPIASASKSPSPALCDFNFDGFLDIVVAHNDIAPVECEVDVYNHLGVLEAGWPRIAAGGSSESSPIVADFSGDGIPDIVFGTEGGLLLGWDKNGNDLAGFPLVVNDFVRSTPYADDVDGDGDIDLVFSSWNRNAYVWDFPAAWNATAAQWPTVMHDNQRSGYYGHRVDAPTDVGNPDEPVTAGPPPAQVFARNFPNPFNPTTTIEFGVPASAAAAAHAVPVQLDILDVRGRLVRRLVDGARAPGVYRATWDGRNTRGVAMPSGIYVYRVQTPAATLAHKLALLR